jgi:hypothetical protein
MPILSENKGDGKVSFGAASLRPRGIALLAKEFFRIRRTRRQLQPKLAAERMTHLL